ncbi:MAG: hypothetical protein QOK15_2135 [Nocardioidaceae bacterium]|nr:hypothetical protein [Nocardioidaceae bacterium]
MQPDTKYAKSSDVHVAYQVFDKRGTGLSDRPTDAATPEERMDDIRAVMDAAGSDRAVVFGYSEGANLGALFAATHPQRTRALVVWGAQARWVRSDDYPWGPTPEDAEKDIAYLADNGGPAIGEILAEIESSVTGVRLPPAPERVLATVLFTDIVGSTEKLEAVGDHRWRELLDAHHARVRRLLQRYDGTEIDTAGDGFLADAAGQG